MGAVVQAGLWERGALAGLPGIQAAEAAATGVVLLGALVRRLAVLPEPAAITKEELAEVLRELQASPEGLDRAAVAGAAVGEQSILVRQAGMEAREPSGTLLTAVEAAAVEGERRWLLPAVAAVYTGAEGAETALGIAR